MPYVLPLGRAHGAEAGRSGPKAANLSLLMDAGLPVPNGFVITTDALDHTLHSSRVQTQAKRLLADMEKVAPNALGERPAQLRSLVQNARLPEAMAGEIRSAYAALGGAPVAVRSSSTMEDRGDVSFAGQHDTVLNVRTEEELWQALRVCWASLWSDRAMHYLRAMGVPPVQVKMGVIVQELVAADASGVAFTANPMNGALGEVVISAALGLGEGTVSGSVATDEAVVTREPLAVQRHVVGAKATKFVANESGGTREVESTTAEAGSAALTEQQVLQVAMLAVRAEKVMGGGLQDVEWAFRSGELHLLQARPMVAMAAPDTDVRWESPVPGAHWRRNWRLGEWLSDPVTPLFSTWAVPLLVAARENSGTGALGWKQRQTYAMPQPWFTVINGYFYTRQDRPPRPPAGRPDPQALAQRVGVLQDGLEHWREHDLPSYIEHFQTHLRRDIAATSSPDLLRFVETLIGEAGEFWHLLAPIGYAVEERSFKPYFESVVTDDGRPHYAAFFSGFPNKAMEGQGALHSMAQAFGADATLSAWLLRQEPETVAQQPEALPTWLRDGLSAYQAAYGHQLYSLDFFFSTMGEVPGATIRVLQDYLRYDVPSPSLLVQQAAADRKAAEEHASERLADRPEELELFRRVLAGYQACAASREDVVFYFQFGWPLIRQSILELGRRLVGAAVLSEREEIFFVEQEALFDVVAKLASGEAAPSLAHGAAGLRQAWERHRRLSAPDAVPVDDYDEARAQDGRKVGLVKDEHGAHLVGQSASPGRAQGRACIVHSPEDAASFARGDILVTASASPALTPLLLIAGGLVTEAGGGASHCSLIARELGLPTVMNTGVATQVVHPGQLLEVNGTRGIVRLLD